MNFKAYYYAEGWKASMVIKVSNNSDSPISGKDYTIKYKCYESNGYTDESERSYTTTLSHKGIDLGPHETKNLTITRGEDHQFYDFKVVPSNVNGNSLKNNFKPTGKEYQEYLRSNKK